MLLEFSWAFVKLYSELLRWYNGIDAGPALIRKKNINQAEIIKRKMSHQTNDSK